MQCAHQYTSWFFLQFQGGPIPTLPCDENLLNCQQKRFIFFCLRFFKYFDEVLSENVKDWFEYRTKNKENVPDGTNCKQHRSISGFYQQKFFYIFILEMNNEFHEVIGWHGVSIFICPPFQTLLPSSYTYILSFLSVLFCWGSVIFFGKYHIDIIIIIFIIIAMVLFFLLNQCCLKYLMK